MPRMRKTSVTRAAPPAKRSKFTTPTAAVAGGQGARPMKDHEKSKAAEDAFNEDSDATDCEDGPPKVSPSPPHNFEPTTTTDDEDVLDTAASGEALGEEEQHNDDDEIPYKDDDLENIDDLYDHDLPEVIDLASAGSNSTIETPTTMKLKDAILQKVEEKIVGSLKFAMNVYCTKAFNNYKGLYGDNATMDGTFMQEFVKDTVHI
jgi:hypothetical protein